MKPARNKHILLAIIFIVPLALFAQRRPPGNFRLGFTVSPTFGWIKFSDNSSSHHTSGLKTASSYGLMGDFGFSDNYFFGTGFTLTTMGGTVQEMVIPNPETIDYKIQYIEIPLTLKLKSDDNNHARFYGQFGPDLGIKVSNKHTLTQLNIQDDAELIRLGLLAGAGAEWKLRSSTLLTGVSFNNPFTKVFKDPDAKNYIVTLNLGIFF